MKKYIYIIVILIEVFSCSKYPNPSVELVSGYTFKKSGSEQRAFAGEFLKDSLSLQVFGQNALINGLTVEFTIVDGGGELTKPTTILDESGLAFTQWKLGSLNNQQTVKASIYNLDGSLLNSVSFNAYAFSSNVWNEVNSQPDANIWDLVADTVKNVTFMIAGGTLYKQNERYYNWIPQINLPNGLTTVKKDSRYNLYASNSIGNIYKSTDNGNIWNECTRPFATNNYMEMFVSNNDYLWVTDTDKKLFCSKDGGNSWIPASIGLTDSDGLGEIYKHPKGTLFFRSTRYRLLKSEDDGKSWTSVVSQNRADKLFITTKNEILIYAGDGKHRIMKSIDNGEHFTEIYSISSNTWTSKLNFFNYYKGTYFFIVPGIGIVRSTDLVNFEVYWDKPNIFNLFVDHDGVLIVRDLNYHLYYRKNL